NDTKVIQKLDALRQRYAPLRIELWGRHRLSELLRDTPALVSRFFGPATASAFCSKASAGSDRAVISPLVAADAVLRGPVAHLGLAQELSEADSVRESNPMGAAATYGAIAAALEESPYAPHAPQMRRRQAEALRMAGDQAGAFEADLKIIASALASGDPGEALRVAQPLADLELNVPDSLIRAFNVLATIASYEHDHQGTLEVAAD